MSAGADYEVNDTIVARASSSGGLRGVVRLSGPEVARVLSHCLEDTGPSAWRDARQPTVATVTIRGQGWLSRAPGRLYYWPTCASYTRQPSAELHCSGAEPVLDAVVAAACQAGARMALPGEFTLRAFLAGRIDLLQAEGVLALVNARTAPQMTAALAQLAGGASRPLHRLRERLLDVLAEVEAGLDFVDEDIEFIDAGRLAQEIDWASDEVKRCRDRLDHRTAARAPRVVICGEPNVGKSSLLNRLCEGDAALVSAVAGTTRDYVERAVVWQGTAITLVDTAGLRAGLDGDVGEQSQAAAREQMQDANLVLWCQSPPNLAGNSPAIESEDAELPNSREQTAPPRILVRTKCDVEANDESAERSILPLDERIGPIARTSSRTGMGVPELRRLIVARLADDLCSAAMLESTSRCRQALRLAGEALAEASSAVQRRAGEELVAAELRGALAAIGQVVGAVHADDLLDQIFRKFCLGK